MIILHINPAKVERVLFQSNSEIEEDFDFAAWQIIRPFVNKIDRTLKEITGAMIKSSEKDYADKNH